MNFSRTAQHAGFDRVYANIVAHTADLLAHKFRRHGQDTYAPSVFWAVRAVRAVMA